MNWRILLPALVTAFALLAALDIGITRKQRLSDALVVIDITRSMNVRDMGGKSRLDFARDTLRDWIATRPCGSRIGFALFTERRSLTLLEPVEVCADYTSLSGTLTGLDWRMAWDGDSMIQKGLDHSLKRAQELEVPLIFVTDGQEAPPLPFEQEPRQIDDSPGGLIIGVGQETPSQIPKFDDLGREVGFYGPNDVQHAPARIGAPPPDASERPGYHPRNNPYGESDLDGDEHLSSLRSDYLQARASARGLGFLRMDGGPAAIERALDAHAPTHPVTVTRSLAPVFGSAALLLLLWLWLTGSRFLNTSRKELRPHDCETFVSGGIRGNIRCRDGIGPRSDPSTGRR